MSCLLYEGPMCIYAGLACHNMWWPIASRRLVIITYVGTLLQGIVLWGVERRDIWKTRSWFPLCCACECQLACVYGVFLSSISQCILPFHFAAYPSSARSFFLFYQ
ncbi:hypothetical protein B0T24DRAFT_608184 [Lasiosphaeria ovina]|uniref:Uncharacterized protein n=1 Tax=Lasiosphaeria ovina TaxID=92902 RepID=A0AAE0NMN0_9PEZI|nr:hypothetical protein B0T24DRAFT_608184 [Lasiosphaeria ovina]